MPWHPFGASPAWEQMPRMPRMLRFGTARPAVVPQGAAGGGMGEDGVSVGRVESRLRPFGEALAEALGACSWTQRELADALGITQSAISAWKYGNAEPSPVTVFRIEQVLGIEPGTLSIHLGFLPVGAGSAEVSFDAAIACDPRLDDQARRVLRATYRELAQG